MKQNGPFRSLGFLRCLLALATVCASASANPGGAPQNSDFSDRSTWIRWVAGSGVQLAPRDQGFDVAYAANAQPSPGNDSAMSGSFISTFALRGDFTIEVDYALTTWPASSGVRLGLGLCWPSIGMIREGQGPYTQEQYTFGAGPYVHVQTGDQHGTLRLVRKGGTLLGYYRSLADGSWVLAGSRTGDPVFTNDFQVSISSWTDGPTFGHEAVGITLSHFVMTADTVLPGPYGVPFRVLAPETHPVAPITRFDNGIRPGQIVETLQKLQPAPNTPSKSNFSDASTWSRFVVGAGVQLTPADNGFEAVYPSGVQPDANGALCAGYVSTFALHGDFTMDIDYTLKTWPPSGGVRLGLDVWPSINMIREGQGPDTQEEYSFGSGPFVKIPTGDRRGALRLARKGGTLLGYYRSSSDGPWVLAGARSGNPVFLQDFQVSVQSWADSSCFGGQPVAVSFGNFVMTADTVLPGPYGIPSWKMGPAEQQETSLPQLKQLDVSPPPSRRAIRPLESDALPTGILDEDLNLDLNAAIQSYQTLVTQFDAQRPLAANAIFRMAECYRRLGRTDEARSLYARILREFADQVPLVRLSRKHVASLAGPGAGSSPPQPVFGSRKPAPDLTSP